MGLLRFLVEQVVGVARSVPAALDAFAALPEAPMDELAVDPTAVYRALHLFAGADDAETLG